GFFFKNNEYSSWKYPLHSFHNRSLFVLRSCILQGEIFWILREVLRSSGFKPLGQFPFGNTFEGSVPSSFADSRVFLFESQQNFLLLCFIHGVAFRYSETF